ncbi:MAG: NAD-dependent epimerase/dehydratase family protein [Pirellulales bacterium]
MTTLVTGATGLVGNNVVRALLDQGCAVRVLARETADPRPLMGLDVEIARGDVRDAEAVQGAVRGTSAVVHAAARVHIGWQGLAAARAINVEGTRHVAAAACREGVRMVHVSSIDALGLATRKQSAHEDTPATGGVLCPYVVTKREAEATVLAHVEQGLQAAIVNPGFMIGPYDWKPSSGRMLLQVAKGWGLFAPLGANSYCDVRDVTAGILAALARGQAGRRYILAGEVLTYFQAWRTFARVTGGTPPIVPIGFLARKGSGYFGDVCRLLTGREPDVNSATMAISGQWRNYSSARAEAELGYRARPLAESAADAWSWFRANGYV